MDTARPRIEPDLLALIALGGGLGAALRHCVGLVAPGGAGGLVWATFAINVVGTFLLAALHAYVPSHPGVPRRLRALLGAGMLGGFTTFSAYAGQTRALLADGHAALALVYVLGTVAAALVAVEAARWVVPVRER